MSEHYNDGVLDEKFAALTPAGSHAMAYSDGGINSTWTSLGVSFAPVVVATAASIAGIVHALWL